MIGNKANRKKAKWFSSYLITNPSYYYTTPYYSFKDEKGQRGHRILNNDIFSQYAKISMPSLLKMTSA